MKIVSTIINNIKSKKWVYILIIMLAFFSDDSFWAATSGNEFLGVMRYVLVVFIPVFFIFILGVNVSKNLKTILTAIIFGIIFASVCSGSGFGGPVMVVFSLLSAALIVSKIDIHFFTTAFCEVVVVMIIYSFSLQMLIFTGILQTTLAENVAGSSVSVLGGCVFYESYFGLILRNGCFFREPGVFMVYICIAYLFDIWMNWKGLSLRRQLVYFLGVFSTLSTAGIIIWALLFSMNIISKGTIKIKNIIPMLMVIIVAYLVFSNEIIFGNVFAKLDRGTDSSSVLGRLSSVTIPLNISLKSPLWGCGTERFRDLYIMYGKMLYHTNVDPQGLGTNSILNAAAVFGLWYGLFIIIGFWRLSRRLAFRSSIGCILSFFSIIMFFSNESMFYSLIFYILVFYGYLNKNDNVKICKQISTPQ